MAVNHYFNNFNSKQEQNLVEDLICEAIKIYGFDANYIPNTNEEQRDLLFGDDPTKRFTVAYPLEMYLVNSMDYGDEHDFYSKFGLTIKNSVKVQVSRRSFSQRVPQNLYPVPREGDLVYVPFLQNTGELYEIKFVNAARDLYTLGRKTPYFYELSLEPFKYSQEQLDTGHQEVDMIPSFDAYAINFTLGTGTGNYKVKEIVYQGGSINTANASGTVAAWNNPNKILKLTNIVGNFKTNTNIIGVQSNSTYNLVTYDTLDYPQERNGFDNLTIEQEAEVIINTSETNPFGILGKVDPIP